jgi:hypothetical protein
MTILVMGGVPQRGYEISLLVFGISSQNGLGHDLNGPDRRMSPDRLPVPPVAVLGAANATDEMGHVPLAGSESAPKAGPGTGPTVPFGGGRIFGTSRLVEYFGHSRLTR